MSIPTRLGASLGSSARPLTVSWCQSAAHLNKHRDLVTVNSHKGGVRLRCHNGNPLGRRNFSVVPLLETAINDAEKLITGLHQITGTPWFLTIPLVALSINLLARLPLTLYTQRLHQRRAKLAPLLQAWYVYHSRHISKQGAASGEDFQRAVVSKFGKTSKRLYKAFGVQGWKAFSGFASFPFWLTGIEALRRMCGGPRGLLGNLVFGQKERNLEGETASPAPPNAVLNTDGAQMGNSTLADLSGSLPLGSDPSLATGGCLWFPDLMAPDPLHILPFLLSAVLALNVLPRTAAGMRALFSLQPRADQQTATPAGSQAATTTFLPTGRARLQRVLLGVALVVGPVTMDLPAALHIYWLSSATITYVQTEAIGRLMKIPNSKVRQCTGVESLISRPGR